MFFQQLGKHLAEFRRAIRNRKYEQTPTGILLPTQRAMIGGVWTHGLVGGPMVADKNLIVTEGLNHILAVALGATAKPVGYYIALYTGATSPLASWTAANFAGNATENTSTSEGYTASTRPVWTPGSASAGAINNTASQPTLTIAATTTVTFQGAALLTSNVRGGTSGVLVSAVRFALPEILNNGATWTCGYTISITDAD